MAPRTQLAGLRNAPKPALRLRAKRFSSPALYGPAASSSAASTSSTPFRQVHLPQPVQFRSFRTSTSRLNGNNDAEVSEGIAIKTLTAGEYEQVSDDDMERLHDNVEILCEAYLTGAEVEYSSGVMTLSTPSGTYVINKQPPNQQIWISSPFSGPARFGYSPDGKWVHHRQKGVTLGGLLDEELRALAGKDGEGWEGTGLQ